MNDMKGNLARAFRRMGVEPTDSSKFDLDSMVSDHLEKAVIEFGGVKREIMVTNRVDRAGVFASIEADNQSDDSLTKAAIGRGFSYGSEAFPIEKTGKEIKEKLLFAIDYDNTEAAVSYAQAEELVKDCDTKPTRKDIIDDWDTRGLKARVGVIPPMYSWEDIDNVGYQVPIQVGETTYSVSDVKSIRSNEMTPERKSIEDTIKAKRDKMREYNRLVRNYVDCRVQAILLGTIADSLNDKKTYKMNVEQAAQLGF